MNRKFAEAIIETGKRIMSNPGKYQNVFASGGVPEYNDLISNIFECLTDNAVVGDSYYESQYIIQSIYGYFGGLNVK